MEILSKVSQGRKEWLTSLTIFLIQSMLKWVMICKVSAFVDHTMVLFLKEVLQKKRGIAVMCLFGAENCIQCNFCSYVCLHAVIRPVAQMQKKQQISEE